MAVIESLLEATLASSVAILLVLCLRLLLRRAFGARVAYGAWALVPVAVIAVLLPAGEVGRSVMPIVAMPAGLPAMITAPMAAAFDPRLLLGACWIAGVILFAAWTLLRQRRFRRSLGPLRRRGDGTLECRCDVAGLPATIGFWPPQVVVPPGFERRYAAVQRELMLSHERAHAIRGDTHANALVALVRAVFWFNPLCHVAAARFRQDQELACDATVLARHPQARRQYGEALLDAQLSAQCTPLACHFGFGHPLRERIAMLGEQLPSRSRRAAGALLVSTLAFGTAFAVWAAQPPAATPANGITVLSLTPPEYPQLAMEHHLSGSVMLRVEVAPDGHVANAIVESAVPRGIFEEAAIAAVRTWRFQPAMKDGRPVAQQVRVPIRFAPREPGEDEARADAGTFDAAAYDWTKIDLSAPYVADVSCDVMKGNIADDIVDCGKLRN